MQTDNESAGPACESAPAVDRRRSAAVALAYGAGDTAPRVIAKGRGAIADAIIARAKESGLYVHESAELVALLMQVDLDACIPPGLYVAVAEVLAWLYRHDCGAAALSRHPVNETTEARKADDSV